MAQGARPVEVVALSRPNIYGYVVGDPVNWTDPSGLVTLEYRNGYLYVNSNDGERITMYPAGNNTTNPAGDPNVVGSNGPAPHGTFPVQSPVDTNGRIEYGPYFFPVGAVGSNGERLDIARRRGIGVHGGRSGPQSRTQGCIRIGNDAAQDLFNINEIDPVTEITIH